MRITNYVAGAVRDHIDTHMEASNDRPDNLTGRGRPFMGPIVEFVGRNCLQNVPGEVVFNFETVLIELQRTGSGATWHGFSPESAGSAAAWDSPYNPLQSYRRNIPAAAR